MKPFRRLLPACALLLFAAGASAQDVTVCPSGCDYTSIQDAVDAVPGGGRVLVGSGTYAESVRIDKPLTLRGTGVGSTIIDVSGQPGWGVSTFASDVVIRDLTVSGAAAYYSLKISGIEGRDPEAETEESGGFEGTPAFNVTVRNVRVEGSQRTGLDVNGVYGFLAEDVVVVNSNDGNGVTLADVRDATLRRVTTANNDWGGAAIYTSGKHFPIGVSTVTFRDVNFQERVKLYVQLDCFDDPGTPAPATRLYVYTAQFPYYYHAQDRGAIFTDRPPVPIGYQRTTPSDCVNVTPNGVKRCTPIQAEHTLTDGAPGLAAIEAVTPNPIVDGAAVRFTLPDVGHVRLGLYDLLGRELAVFAEGEFVEGVHTVTVDAPDLPAGLYLVRLVSPYGTATRRVTLTR